MIPELAELLRKSVAESLEDRVAVSFSGGLDSTLIAAVAKEHSETGLFACGTGNSKDLEYSEEAARLLGLPLHKTVMTEDSILRTYRLCHEIVPGELPKVELLVPVYKCAEAAKAAGHEVLLFGSAAEELFVGYERYFAYLDGGKEGKGLQALMVSEFKELKHREIAWISKVCRKLGIEARFPLYKPELEKFARSIPLEVLMEDRERKKGVLREAGKLLGVPESVLQRKKHAMQYGSGIHKIILKHAGELPGGRIVEKHPTADVAQVKNAPTSP